MLSENLPLQPDSNPTKTEQYKTISLATKIFAEVSTLYPASGMAQGTAIAKYCQEHQLNPIVLRDALVQSDEGIRIIVNAAEHAHDARGKKVSGVNSLRAKSIISADFTRANALMSVSVEKLDEILGKYSYFSHEGGGDLGGEYGYLNFAKNLTQIDFFYLK